MLFTPARHEPLAGRPFSEAAAREAIARIAARAERELDAADGRWPLDPVDAGSEREGPSSDLYWGAAGVAWALGELAAEGYVAPGIVDREFVEAMEARFLDDADDPDDGVWWGGIGGASETFRSPQSAHLTGRGPALDRTRASCKGRSHARNRVMST